LSSNRKKELVNARLLAISSIAVLIATRLARRWNQTGQKFAGEPDISRTFFSEHRLVLWLLIALTYLWNLQCLAARAFSRFPQLIAGAIATSLATAALTFKLAFTNEDSPELMTGIAKSMADSEVGVSLVARARIAFIAITLALFYTLGTGFSLTKKPNSKYIPSIRPSH
jgi:ethanolaminephosphotransferase